MQKKLFKNWVCSEVPTNIAGLPEFLKKVQESCGGNGGGGGAKSATVDRSTMAPDRHVATDPSKEEVQEPTAVEAKASESDPVGESGMSKKCVISTPDGVKPGGQLKISAGGRIVGIRCPFNSSPVQVVKIQLPVVGGEQHVVGGGGGGDGGNHPNVPSPEEKSAPDSHAANQQDRLSPKVPGAILVDESFLSDADGNGSLAAVIGRT